MKFKLGYVPKLLLMNIPKESHKDTISKVNITIIVNNYRFTILFYKILVKVEERVCVCKERTTTVGRDYGV